MESDGSAHFTHSLRALPVFFQALDARGFAVQTMRSLTYVQPGETLSCVGCHEPRRTSPPAGGMPLAARRSALPDHARTGRFLAPALRSAGPARARQEMRRAATVRTATIPKLLRSYLTADRSYETLLGYADNDLRTLAFEKDRSMPGDCAARQSKLLQLVTGDKTTTAPTRPR